MVFLFGGVNGDSSHSTFRLTDGQSPVVSTSDRAKTLELLGSETRRIPIRLHPGEVTTLGP